jgi:hypothetical protein
MMLDAVRGIIVLKLDGRRLKVEAAACPAAEGRLME